MKPAAILLKLIVLGSFLCCAAYFVLSGNMWSCGGFFAWLIVSTLMAVICTIAMLPIILFVGFVGYLLGF